MTAPTNGFQTLHRLPDQHTLASEDGSTRVRAVQGADPGWLYVFIQTTHDVNGKPVKMWTAIALRDGIAGFHAYGRTRDQAQTNLFDQFAAADV